MANDLDPVASASVSPHERKQRVLVVEYEPNIARLCRVYLERAGYLVSTVASGSDALMAMRQIQADIIVTDMLLPDTSCFGLMERIRSESEWAALPFVVLVQGTSGPLSPEMMIGQQDNRLSIAETYRVAALRKPFDPSIFVAAVKEQLRSGPSAFAWPSEPIEVKLPGRPVRILSAQLLDSSQAPRFVLEVEETNEDAQ